MPPCSAQALAELDEVFVLDGGGGDFEHSHYCVAAVLDDRTAQRRPEIIAHLNAAGVGTSVYYPKPVPHMSYYRDKYRTPAGAFPNASRISDQSIALHGRARMSTRKTCATSRTC